MLSVLTEYSTKTAYLLYVLCFSDTLYYGTYNLEVWSDFTCVFGYPGIAHRFVQAFILHPYLDAETSFTSKKIVTNSLDEGTFNVLHYTYANLILASRMR